MKKFFFFLSFSIALVIHAQIISTIAGTGPGGVGTGGFSGDGGPAISAQLYQPNGVVFDASGNLYISDDVNNCIRKINTAGIISTFAGNHTNSFSGDGGPATAAGMMGPAAVTIDGNGNLYITDYYNSRIRKVNVSGIISTVAGNGTQGFSGDGGLATGAQLYPAGLTVDAIGNLYIADVGNNRVRKVSTSGIITTVAGTGTQGYSGDSGQAISAWLYHPAGIVFDAVGDMYVTDAGNYRIRKISTSGIITTIAGNGTQGFSGDGGLATAAQLSAPDAITIDAVGNLYFTDTYDQRIRMISTSGIITTIAGNGTIGFSGDGGLATLAEFDYPTAIAFDTSGNLFIADYDNQRVRMITNVAGVNEIKSNSISLNVLPNPNSGTFVLNAQKEIGSISVFNTLGEIIYYKKTKENSCSIDLTSQPSGIYFLRAQNQFIKLVKE